MRVLMIAGGVALIAALVVFQQSMGVGIGDIWNAILGWSIAQQAAVAVIAAVVVFFLAVSLWQSDRIAQQSQAIDILQKRMSGLRDDSAAAEEQQSGADAAIRHLVGTDPVAIIDDVQQRLTDAETRTAQQAVQNEAVDLQSRIDEIRSRQQALRTQLGTVSEKRRTIEPMLGEVKERQALIERSLGDLEKDETGKNIHTRLEEAEGFLSRGHTRLDALEKAFGSLTEIRDRLEKLHSEVTPLKSADTGVKALLGSVVAAQNRLDAALLSLEKDDSETIGARIERLSKAKADMEQRIASLNECFGSLEAMRSDIGSHFDKLHFTLEGHRKRDDSASPATSANFSDRPSAGAL
jgi:chromosome segregation ATPase